MSRHTLAFVSEQFAAQGWSTLLATHGGLRAPWDRTVEDGTWHVLVQDQTGLPTLQFCGHSGGDLSIPSPAVQRVVPGKALINASYRIIFLVAESYDFSQLAPPIGQPVEIELVAPRAAARKMVSLFQAQANSFNEARKDARRRQNRAASEHQPHAVPEHNVVTVTGEARLQPLTTSMAVQPQYGDGAAFGRADGTIEFVAASGLSTILDSRTVTRAREQGGDGLWVHFAPGVLLLLRPKELWLRFVEEHAACRTSARVDAAEEQASALPSGPTEPVRIAPLPGQSGLVQWPAKDWGLDGNGLLAERVRQAEAGDTERMTEVAHFFSDSDDPMAAQHWFLRAAESGVASALYYLGLMCERYELPEEALHWYAEGEKAGSSDVYGAASALCISLGRVEEARLWSERGRAAGVLSGYY